jgi:hypothetical protein
VAAADATELADLTTADVAIINKCLYSIAEADPSRLTGSDSIRDKSYTCRALYLIR